MIYYVKSVFFATDFSDYTERVELKFSGDNSRNTRSLLEYLRIHRNRGMK
jgi:hypothetical protein